MASSVADKSQAVIDMAVDWRLATALLGGTRAMRVAAAMYLPKWPQEDPLTYGARLSSATLFPAFKRTVITLAGKPFAKPITYGKDVPPKIREWCENDVDMQKRDLHTFAGDCEQVAIAHGLGGILVDYPEGDAPKTQAEEAAQGRRPYMVLIRPEQLLGWRFVVEDGETELTMLRYMESVDVDDGPWGVKRIDQVRVLEPGKWTTFREQTGQAPGAVIEWVPEKTGTTSLADIPFVPFYGERLGFMEAKPPLIELAHMNVEHWQSSSDQRAILHVARVPILAASGVDDPAFEVIVGASACVKLPFGAKLEYVEHSGKAIAAGATDLQDLEERMRQAGAELLIPHPGRVTAFQVASENAIGASVLQSISLGLEDALDQALQYMAEFAGLPNGGHVTLFNDYAAFNLAEASAALIVTANVAGKISDETLFKELQRRAMLSGDINWEDEKQRLQDQGPALGTMNGSSPGGPGAPKGGPPDGGVPQGVSTPNDPGGDPGVAPRITRVA